MKGLLRFEIVEGTKQRPAGFRCIKCGKSITLAQYRWSGLCPKCDMGG